MAVLRHAITLRTLSVTNSSRRRLGSRSTLTSPLVEADFDLNWRRLGGSSGISSKSELDFIWKDFVDFLEQTSVSHKKSERKGWKRREEPSWTVVLFRHPEGHQLPTWLPTPVLMPRVEIMKKKKRGPQGGLMISWYHASRLVCMPQELCCPRSVESAGCVWGRYRYLCGCDPSALSMLINPTVLHVAASKSEPSMAPSCGIAQMHNFRTMRQQAKANRRVRSLTRHQPSSRRVGVRPRVCLVVPNPVGVCAFVPCLAPLPT